MKFVVKALVAMALLASTACNAEPSIDYEKTWYGYKWTLDGETVNPGTLWPTEMSRILMSEPESKKEFNKSRLYYGIALLSVVAVASSADTNSELAESLLVSMPIYIPLTYMSIKHLNKSIDLYKSKNSISVYPSYKDEGVSFNLNYRF